jgi:hypothetical protein
VRRSLRACASASFHGNSCNLLGDAVLHRLAPTRFQLSPTRFQLDIFPHAQVEDCIGHFDSRNCNRTVGSNVSVLKFLSPAEEVLHNKQQSAVSVALAISIAVGHLHCFRCSLSTIPPDLITSKVLSPAKKVSRSNPVCTGVKLFLSASQKCFRSMLPGHG